MDKMKVGDIVEFPYYGGTNYGEVRRVKVENLTYKHVEGTDVDSLGFRRYLRSEMGTVKVVSKAKVQWRNKKISFVESSGYFDIGGVILSKNAKLQNGLTIGALFEKV